MENWLYRKILKMYRLFIVLRGMAKINRSTLNLLEKGDNVELDSIAWYCKM